MFGHGRDASEGGPEELFAQSAPVSLGKASPPALTGAPATSAAPTSGLTPEQIEAAERRGLDPERVAALAKPISARELWGFWIPLIVGCVGGSIYLWTHTDPADARHSPAAIALFPLFAAFWWKTRGLHRRTTPARQLPPGLRGIWARMSRRNRVSLVKFGAFAVATVGFGVAKVIGAGPHAAGQVGFGLGVVTAVAGIVAVRRTDAADADDARGGDDSRGGVDRSPATAAARADTPDGASAKAPLGTAGVGLLGPHDVGPPGYVEPAAAQAAPPVDERDAAARRALGGLDPNAPATYGNLMTVLAQPWLVGRRRRTEGPLTKRDKWSIVAFFGFAALMEAAHLAGAAHHHKGLYIGLWFAVVSAIVFGAALFDDSRWGTQSAKKARDAARARGTATTTPRP